MNKLPTNYILDNISGEHAAKGCSDDLHSLKKAYTILACGQVVSQCLMDMSGEHAVKGSSDTLHSLKKAYTFLAFGQALS